MTNVKRSSSPSNSFFPELPLIPLGSILRYNRLPVVCWQTMITTSTHERQRWPPIEHLPFRQLYLPDLGLTPELRALTGMLKDEREKPAQSYIGLIATAILESKEKRLLLGDIYKWVLKNYPYFRSRGSGWRNSIRHNLSLNDCFVKAGRSASGKGHYWSVHKANVDDFSRGDFRRKKALRKAKKAMLKTATRECCNKMQMLQKVKDEVDSETFDFQVGVQILASEMPEKEQKPKALRDISRAFSSGKSFDVRTILGIN